MVVRNSIFFLLFLLLLFLLVYCFFLSGVRVKERRLKREIREKRFIPLMAIPVVKYTGMMIGAVLLNKVAEIVEEKMDEANKNFDENKKIE